MKINKIQAQPGFQEKFLSSEADIVIGGSGAGVGKSYSELLEALRHSAVPGFSAVFFRRTTVQITNPGGLWDEASLLYPLFNGVAQSQKLKWIFPSGAVVKFSHLEYEQNVYDHQGAQYCLIIFDEIDHFSRKQFFYLLSRNRSTCGVKPYVRATCLSEKSIVSTSDGKLLSIAKCTVDDELLSINKKTGIIFSEKPSAKFSKDVIGARITTIGGEIEASNDHIFFKWSKNGIEETKVDQLKVGDWLATARKIPHGTKVIDKDESYLVGFTIGDGGITGRKTIPRILWTDGSLEHAEYIQKVSEKVLACKIGIHKRKQKKAWSIYTTKTSEHATKFISDYKEIFIPSNERFFPETITCGNEEAIKALLQGVFDAEASVQSNKVSIATISAVLMSQILILLRRFGIYARMDIQQPKPPRKRVYRISIRGVQAINFIEKIGFRYERKQKLALEIIKGAKRGVCASDADMIPICRESIKHIRRFFGNSWWNRNEAIRRETADAVLLKCNENNIEDTLLTHWSIFSWEKISRIKTGIAFQAYDITMPTEHTFLAGCFVSHNCNPNADSFVADLIAWWIDQDERLPNGDKNSRFGYPIVDRIGVIRYFLVDNDNYVWGDTKREVIDKCPHIFNNPAFDNIDYNDLVKSLTFIPGSIYDNKKLLEKNPEYLGNLMALDEDEKLRLLYGNWKVKIDPNCIFNALSIEGMFSNLYPSNTNQRYITCDAARLGEDMCTIFVWYGWKVVHLEVMTTSLAQEVVDVIENLRGKFSIMKGHVVVDQDGVGNKVVKLGHYVGFSGADVPLIEPGMNIKEFYKNRKTQFYYRFADRVNNDEVSMPLSNDNVRVDGFFGIKVKRDGKILDIRDLIKQDFRAIKVKDRDGEGKKQINSKEEQKTLLRGRSPDFSDGASLRVWFEMKSGNIVTGSGAAPSILDRIK